jgi:hypothetical protein
LWKQSESGLYVSDKTRERSKKGEEEEEVEEIKRSGIEKDGGWRLERVRRRSCLERSP